MHQNNPMSHNQIMLLFYLFISSKWLTFMFVFYSKNRSIRGKSNGYQKSSKSTNVVMLSSFNFPSMLPFCCHLFEKKTGSFVVFSTFKYQCPQNEQLNFSIIDCMKASIYALKICKRYFLSNMSSFQQRFNFQQNRD